jgi:hypothetical protein
MPARPVAPIPLRGALNSPVSTIENHFTGINRRVARSHHWKPLTIDTAARECLALDYIKRRIKMSNIRNAAIAAITSASLSLLAMSVAQAQGGEKTLAHKAIYNTTRDASTVNRATPALDGTFHMNLTWPEGSPDYHGSNGG